MTVFPLASAHQSEVSLSFSFSLSLFLPPQMKTSPKYRISNIKGFALAFGSSMDGKAKKRLGGGGTRPRGPNHTLICELMRQEMARAVLGNGSQWDLEQGDKDKQGLPGYQPGQTCLDSIWQDLRPHGRFSEPYNSFTSFPKVWFKFRVPVSAYFTSILLFWKLWKVASN